MELFFNHGSNLTAKFSHINVEKNWLQYFQKTGHSYRKQ